MSATNLCSGCDEGWPVENGRHKLNSLDMGACTASQRRAHTPGPWHVVRPDFVDAGPGLNMTGDSRNSIAQVYGPDATGNARLIAAAPEAVEALDNVTAALETVMAHYSKHMTAADVAGRERVIAEARAVLAKARQV